jgi:uncharacterized protein with GYD domain
MGTYTALVEVEDSDVQNVQGFASIWGEIRNDVEMQGGEMVDAYAVLGEYDFLLLFEADDPEQAMQISIGVERYGLDTQTMEVIPVDRMGELVDDI